MKLSTFENGDHLVIEIRGKQLLALITRKTKFREKFSRFELKCVNAKTRRYSMKIFAPGFPKTTFVGPIEKLYERLLPLMGVKIYKRSDFKRRRRRARR